MQRAPLYGQVFSLNKIDSIWTNRLALWSRCAQLGAARIHNKPVRGSELVTQANRRFEQRVIAKERLVRACTARQRGPCAGQVVVVHAHINVGSLAEEVVKRRAGRDPRTACIRVMQE